MSSLHLIVRDQFPEFVRADYPVFVEFVKAYYKWLDLQSVGKIENVVDIDNTPEEFVQYFRRQLDVHGLLTDSVPFNKMYLRKIKQIYNSKGSEQALITLLKIVHNIDAVVRYPSENILKASDGRWVQNNFIVVDRVYGTMPSTVDEFYILYDTATIRVACESAESLSGISTRLTFKPKSNVSINVGQVVYIYNANGSIVYAGKIVRIPVKVTVKVAGAGWQLGQVIRIPGSIKDTVVRVAELTSTGGVKRIEIIEFGYDHTENQTFVISPYPNKPIGSTYDYTSTQTSSVPVKFLHTLTLNDYLEGVTDRVQGLVSGITPNSYFLEDYVAGSYASSVAFDNAITNSPTDEFETSITMEQWLASRVTLVYEYGVVAIQPGKWASNTGMLSNPDMRLQDDFYYQQFSYDVEANANSASYIKLIKDVHPAGTKLFTTYALDQVLTANVIATTSFPFVRLETYDEVAPDDSNNKLTLKRPADELNPTDFDKEWVTKRPSDSVTPEESDAKLIVKSPSDLITSSEANTKLVTKLPVDLIDVTDTFSVTPNKYVTDTVSIDSLDTSTYEEIQYNADSYFGEDYVLTEKTLTIGA